MNRPIPTNREVDMSVTGDMFEHLMRLAEENDLTVRIMVTPQRAATPPSFDLGVFNRDNTKIAGGEFPLARAGLIMDVYLEALDAHFEGAA